MGGEIVDLVKGFTDQANANSRSENIRNLQELKTLKSQVDEGLQAAGMAPKPTSTKDESSSNEETLIPNIGGMILENEQAKEQQQEKKPSKIESDLMAKIKSKDSLISEIDAQIKRLDKMEK